MSALLAAAAGGFAGAGLAAIAADVLRLRGARHLLAPRLPVRAGKLVQLLAARVPPALGSSTGTESVAQRLEAAGLDRIGVTEWTGLKICAAVAAALSALTLAGSLPGRLSVAAFLVAPAAGFVAPEFWLARVTDRRLHAAGRELAPMLDLLVVTIEAGASPAAALGAIGARFRGPLAAEWRAAATAIALGTPHDRALTTMTHRLPSARIRAFADCMRRARRRGLPLADLLAGQATAARHEQRIRVREQAARAGPKIQLVVAFVLVPSVMLIVAAALIAELTAPALALTYS